MGTVWRVRLAAPAGFDPAPLTHAIAARLGLLVAEMSHWEPASLLSRFNRAKAGQWLSLPPDFATVIAAALDIAARSDGAFDPALGALVDLWGFGPTAPSAPPDPVSVDSARAMSGWRRLDFDPGARRLRQPGGLRLDLSGIAKGYAVDAVADLLQAHGHSHALVEVGGELAGRGIRPDGEPWWVDLENPVAGLPAFRVALHEIAVATSGTYVRGDHNFDPATGRPARHNVVSASVLHRSAMHADAWASALTVLGPEAGLALAAREDLAARIVVRDAAGVREIISPALAALL
jgi:thiamine biosynthesis lipoprotein